jgi:hypothetical protein
LTLADEIVFQGRTWQLVKGHVPDTYRHGNAEVYRTGDHWHSQWLSPFPVWTQLDLFGGHPDPATAVKHVHRVLGWSCEPEAPADGTV